MKKLDCVLLVDDNPHTNIFNKKLIEKHSLANKVYTLENGREAINYLTRQGRYIENGRKYPLPDLIFLDINMPVMDGWEFLEEYRQIKPSQQSNTLVIIFTTSPNEDDEKKARDFKEVTAFKRKPLTGDKLKHIIEEYFPN